MTSAFLTPRLKPHEQPLTLEGPAGNLEAILSLPPQANLSTVALLCHPHPLQEGTMHNKVVTTAARACDEQGLPSLRFNFRGVGASAGQYGDVVGECDDARAARAALEARFHPNAVWYLGFSFGSFVASQVASEDPKACGVIALAPPTERMAFDTLPQPMPMPWWWFHGTDDDVASFEAAHTLATTRGDMTWVPFPDCGHFFHGRLAVLRQQLVTCLATVQP